jgi:hypothetical protein
LKLYKTGYTQSRNSNLILEISNAKPNIPEMKKILLLIPFLAASLYASAQCTPDTSIHENGMYPDSFPPAKVGVSFSQVFQFKFPADTTVDPIGTVAFDSVQISDVKGLPTGFTYQCNAARCSYPGGANGCVTLAGTPDSAKTYKVRIAIVAWGTIAGQPFPGVDTVRLDFKIDSADISGITSHSQLPLNFNVMQNVPNPFSSSTEISFTMPQSQTVTFKVYDVLGKQVSLRTISAAKGKNTITVDRKGMNAGMYFYSIQAGSQVVTKRMSVSN